MRLLCDEGVEPPIVERLRSEGHEVRYVAEMSPGISDEEVLGLSEKGRLVAAAIRDHASEEEKFSVVERDRIRIRRRPKG